jgi:hypothetical protein
LSIWSHTTCSMPTAYFCRYLYVSFSAMSSCNKSDFQYCDPQTTSARPKPLNQVSAIFGMGDVHFIWPITNSTVTWMPSTVGRNVSYHETSRTENGLMPLLHLYHINPLKYSSYYMQHLIYKICIFCTQLVYVFCMILRIKNDYFPEQY